MNRKSICIVLILVIASTLAAEAQSFFSYKRNYRQKQQHIGELSFHLGTGISSYLGDLKASKTKLDAKPNLVFGGQIKFTTHVSFRSELTWYRIAGSDATQPIETGLPSRNLSFRADNFEVHVAGVVHAFPRYSFKNVHPRVINPYFFLGVGTTTNNPTTEYQGGRYNLRKLQTQEKRYSGLALVIPFGLGFDYRLSDKMDLGIETGYRYAFTDQLDDASSPNYIKFDHEIDGVTFALSDRRNEVGIIPGAPSGAGGVRGNPESKDAFLLISVKCHYYLINNKIRTIKYRKPKRGK